MCIPIRILFFLFCFSSAIGQKKELAFKAWDGCVVAGYLDKGTYVNFSGPGVKWSRKPYSLLMGVLPSLRFKEDSSLVKNSLVTPTLGAGLTLSVKKLVLQLPFYYFPKTASEPGRWKAGAGLGYKF